jgi:hypothetical protein
VTVGFAALETRAMLDLFRAVFGVVVLALNTLTPRLADARQPQDGEALLEAQAKPQTSEPTVIRRQLPEGASTRALRFARTELYFGTATSEGPVTEEQFQEFVDKEVSPRFPDGLTITKADGRFRTVEGDLVKEQSFVLVLLYPYETFAEGSRRIERIRSLYKKQFNQQSVLRVDDQFVVWVSF